MDPSLRCFQEIEAVDGSDELISDKRKLLLMMNFSIKDIDYAINALGDEASIASLIDFIVTAQTAGSSGKKDTDDSIQMHRMNEKVTTDLNLYDTMEKTHHLLEMGFSEREVSEAIRNSGSNAPILELADSIFAKQIANAPSQNDKGLEDASVEVKMEMLQNASVIALL